VVKSRFLTAGLTACRIERFCSRCFIWRTSFHLTRVSFFSIPSTLSIISINLNDGGPLITHAGWAARRLGLSCYCLLNLAEFVSTLRSDLGLNALFLERTIIFMWFDSDLLKALSNGINIYLTNVGRMSQITSRHYWRTMSNATNISPDKCRFKCWHRLTGPLISAKYFHSQIVQILS
jgi:hypothetical protein